MATVRPLSPEELDQCRSLLLDLYSNPELGLIKYRSPNGASTIWYCNPRFSTSSETAISSKLANWLLQEDYLMQTRVESNKTLHKLSDKGLEAAKTLFGQSSKRTEPKKQQEEVNIPVQIQDDSATLREFTLREKQILEATDGLTDEEVMKVLFYGIELLKEEVEKQLRASQTRLNVLSEKAQCISS
jgi:hypothetical protein